jgi:hypothetical protein
MYQPDSIHTMEVSGESYMLMANEGDSKDCNNKITELTFKIISHEHISIIQSIISPV